MKDMMSYKEYYGSVHYSDEDRIFHGKIEFIRSPSSLNSVVPCISFPSETNPE